MERWKFWKRCKTALEVIAAVYFIGVAVSFCIFVGPATNKGVPWWATLLLSLGWPVFLFVWLRAGCP